MKPWPGRNETDRLQRRENELELVLLELCLVVRASRLSPSPIPRRQHFLQRTVLGVRFLVKLEAPLYFILFYLRSQDELDNVASLCVVSPRALVACRRFCSLVVCRFFALLSTTRVRPLLVPPHQYGCAVDNESSTRCHTQAVSRLCHFQARCVDKPSLNAAQTLDEQSANAATIPYVTK